MSVERVIEVARGELGTTEYPPGSNHVPYWNDYDERMQGQPWCVAFLWWCFQRAGEKMALFAWAKRPPARHWGAGTRREGPRFR